MHRLFVILSIVGATMAGVSYADNGKSYMHEFNVNSGLGSNFDFQFITSAGGAKNFSVGLGYNYTLHPMFQVGIFPSYALQDTGAATTDTLTLMGGFTFNLNEDMMDSIFLFGAAGINKTGAGTNFTVRGDLGKRFKIWDHVAYRPTVGALWTDGKTVVLNVQLLAASVAF